MATRKKSGPSRRKALAALRIPIEGSRLRAYRDWYRRAAAVGGPVAPLVEFAGWFPVARDEWIDAAAQLGEWHPSTHESFDSARSCHADDPDRVLGHVGDADGTVFHLAVEEDEGRVVLQGRYCRTGVADEVLDHVWTDEQRLGYEELVAGASCRSCGRPFFGGPEWVPILQRTPDQQAVADAEEAAFLGCHPECRAMRWAIQGGEIQHCMRCCPPPPIDPSTTQQASRILATMLIDHSKKQRQLAERWEDAKPSP